jgi:transcriptional regulator with GAF, ATPase, and Fis domain
MTDGDLAASLRVERALSDQRSSSAEARATAGGSSDSFSAIAGQSRALGDVLAQVRTVALTDATVLICGETGTGKELIARGLHQLSHRKQGPFVKVNCGAVPGGLLESELMGHERGAFTGAIARHVGRFEFAQDGTLFLDEIGEMPCEFQPKLLRLLQEREFERVGGTQTIRSNARLVAATNRDLCAMVNERTFREDLFYRLNVFPITLPPLRERREDIPALVECFLRQGATRLQKDVRVVSLTSMARLMKYNWPGNIRELQNVIERAMILARGPTLDVPDLPNPVRSKVEAPQGDDLTSVTRAHIMNVLEATGGVVAGPYGAAARLGVKRSTLNYRMRKLGITPARRLSRNHLRDDAADE